ncbi:hypothetical protein O181_028452 [Austropuccinia psidii MF-1]|uniref:Uncharacterized protein n=1 Tax=Austropuccinia psidii MF-1 TaxID=1389203 RepID=A0A9Q3CRX4_9BASI|nr:hypothetical protein [Austropuccinia psidii MF-1]
MSCQKLGGAFCSNRHIATCISELAGRIGSLSRSYGETSRVFLAKNRVPPLKAQTAAQRIHPVKQKRVLRGGFEPPQVSLLGCSRNCHMKAIAALQT